MARIPQPGDHRGNMHVGARVASFELSERDREICSAIGPTLKAQGLCLSQSTSRLHLAEINVTSPTGIQELNPMFNIRIEEMLTDLWCQPIILSRRNNAPTSFNSLCVPAFAEENGGRKGRCFRHCLWCDRPCTIAQIDDVNRTTAQHSTMAQAGNTLTGFTMGQNGWAARQNLFGPVGKP